MELPVCSHCGFTNRADSRFCTQCGQALDAAVAMEPHRVPETDPTASATAPTLAEAWGSPFPATPDVQVLPSRPGCVTIYAVLLFCGAAANTIIGLSLLRTGRMSGLIFLGLAIAGIVVVTGLFRQKNWARIGVILLMCISIAGVATQALAGDINPYALAALLVPASIIWWFATNKQYFA